jgi:hypothetical protein
MRLLGKSRCGRGTMTFPWSMLREQSRSSIVNRDGARLRRGDERMRGARLYGGVDLFHVDLVDIAVACA